MRLIRGITGMKGLMTFLPKLIVSTILLAACGDSGSDSDVLQDAYLDLSDDLPDENHEFTIRKPAQEALFCQVEFGGEYWLAQLDHVCRIDNSALQGELYIQADPIDCGQFGNPSYSTPAAWLKTNDVVHEVTAQYDFGGRHNNDLISFTFNSTNYVLYHSSIGYGWRACTTPDCMVVCDPGRECLPDTDVDVAIDGCARSAGDPPPALKVICVTIQPDGSVPDFNDPWITQDPYGQEGDKILPCPGEESVLI